MTGEGRGVSIFPSGAHPDRCKAGHSWRTGSGCWITGAQPCDCPNAAGNFRRHQWIRCIARVGDGECGVIWRDPACSHLQRGSG